LKHALMRISLDGTEDRQPGTQEQGHMENPRFTQKRRAFSMACGVEVSIRAPADVIWNLLIDGKGFSRWNSTVTSIEGEIREGERLRLHVPGTERTFTPTVSGVVPNERMTWTGGFAPMFKGVRTFVLKPRNDGSADFAMEERFSGLMLPLVKGSMPDFGPVFERFAGDLKREAERGKGVGPEMDTVTGKPTDSRPPEGRTRCG
jgi:hypothetical protein